MALGRKLADDDPNFKGYKAVAVKTGNIYKYVLGKSSSREEAADSIKVFGFIIIHCKTCCINTT